MIASFTMVYFLTRLYIFISLVHKSLVARGFIAPVVKDHIWHPLQTSDLSETVGVARFVKRDESVHLPYTIFILLSPVNCVFKLTSDAPSTVKYENWHVLGMFTIIDRNPHFSQAFKQAM